MAPTKIVGVYRIRRSVVDNQTPPRMPHCSRASRMKQHAGYWEVDYPTMTRHLCMAHMSKQLRDAAYDLMRRGLDEVEFEA